MRRSFAFVAVLLFVFVPSALAQGGPPVQDGCIFERGATTCDTVSWFYDPNIPLNVGDVFCDASGRLWEVTSAIDGARIALAVEEVTTEFFGVSQVVKSESRRVVVYAWENVGASAVGRC